MVKYSKLFINGKVYTVSEGMPWAEAFAITGNKISFVGSNLEADALRVEAEEVVDLKGMMVLPGFVDGHMHIQMAGPEQLFKVQLHDLDNEKDYIQRIKEYVEAHPEADRYEGVGWINPAFDVKGPRRQALDAICPDKPIVIDSGDHHSLWANTKAFEICGITADTQVPEGNLIEREEDGYPSGTVRELYAMSLFDKARLTLGKEEYKAVIRSVQEFYGPYGVTGLVDALVPADCPIIDAYKEMAEDGELKCRIRGALGLTEDADENQVIKLVKAREKTLHSGDMLRIDEAKVFLDGVIEGKTGFLKEPYEDEEEYRGFPIWDYDKLVKVCKKADEAEFNLHFHTIGDAASEFMCDCLDEVIKNNPDRKNRRPVATHLQVLDPREIERMAEDNFVCISDPFWFFKDKGYYYDIEIPFLGERAAREYPMKSLFDAGMVVGVGSDYSVTPDPSPLAGIQIAMTRLKEDVDPSTASEADVLGPEERVSLEVMLEAYTKGNAYATMDEDIVGTIEVGKYADIVVLAENLFELPIGDIHKAKVVMTISNGETIFEDLT